MSKKIPLTNFTRKSEMIFLKKLSLEDLRTMAYSSSAVVKGEKDLKEHLTLELEMARKYGFKV